MQKKVLDTKNIEDILPLSPIQEGILFQYLRNPDSLIYFQQLVLQINGMFNLSAFKQAWEFVVQNNESLRSAFFWEKLKQPVQIIFKKNEIKLDFQDLSRRSDIERQLSIIKMDDLQKKFVLTETPFRICVCKISDGNFFIIISFHHILLDGWSTSILIEEFLHFYNNFLSKKEVAIISKTPYKHYLKFSRSIENDGEMEYWKNFLNKKFCTAFPTTGKTGLKKSFNSQSFEFDQNNMNELEKFAKKNNHTVASILYTAWGILSLRYTNEDAFVFGTTVSGRNIKLNGIEKMVGLFINTIPFLVNTDSNKNLVQILHEVSQNLNLRKEYETSSIVKIKEFISFDLKSDLFQSLVVFQNYPISHSIVSDNGKFNISFTSIEEYTHYDLTLVFNKLDFSKSRIIYNTHCFEDKTISTMISDFKIILNCILNNKDILLREIELTNELQTLEKVNIDFEFNF